jgi:hypothetical protein
MFDVPVDATYVWFGVGAVSVAVLGVVVGLPGTAPPDATAAANAVDTVAVGPTGATGSYALTAARIRLGTAQIGLENAGGRAHATFAYPVTPALTDATLQHVLEGARPSSVYDSPAAFAAAIERAADRTPGWRPAPDRLTVRRVTWGEADVTLVG